MAPLKIAIIGAGPAGCMLARLLQQANNPNIEARVFESEGSPNFRSQGGTLDLHEKTGQAAMKAAGLWEAFLADARFDGEALKVCDKTLLCYIRMNGASKPKTASEATPKGRPEIDRPRLRQILFESLAKDTVRWGHKLVRVDEDRTLHFADGSTQTGYDLIVGADGAWSRVRPRVSSVAPEYSGISGHSLSILDAEHTQPELYKLVNRGSLFGFSDGKSIMGQQMGDGSINVSTWQQRPVDWQKTAGFDVHDGPATKEDARKGYADWDAKLVDLVLKSDDHVVPRDLYMLPVNHRWEHVPGVTLIGDASHLMTPFAGEGVNLALADSLDLSKYLLNAAKTSGPTTTLDAELKAFEEDMFTRSTTTQELTYKMMQHMYFTEGAPRTSIEKWILEAMADEVGSIGRVALTPLVYAWFGAFKLMHRR